MENVLNIFNECQKDRQFADSAVKCGIIECAEYKAAAELQDYTNSNQQHNQLIITFSFQIFLI